MSKQNDYQRGRMDGLDMAIRIVRQGGVDALEKEYAMRGKWKIHTAACLKELDEASETIKKTCFETLLVASVSVLHDKFGFGKIRSQRYINGFRKLVSYLDHGWLYWYDIITEIEKQLGEKLDLKNLNAENMAQTVWAHPDEEDIYTEQDFIDDSLWKGILKELNFHEAPSIHEEGGTGIFDENGKEFLVYTGRYDKISTYDAMQGILWAKEHYGIVDGKERLVKE